MHMRSLGYEVAMPGMATSFSQDTGFRSHFDLSPVQQDPYARQRELVAAAKAYHDTRSAIARGTVKSTLPKVVPSRYQAAPQEPRHRPLPPPATPSAPSQVYAPPPQKSVSAAEYYAARGMPLQGINHMRMKALGQWEIVGGAMSLLSQMGSKGAPAAGAAPTPANMVSTSVQTTVSPQISPVFVQQDSPSHSPVNANPTQTAPAPQSSTFPMMPGQPAQLQAPTMPGYMPVTGAMPGFDTASGFLPTGTTGLLSQPPMMGAGVSGGAIVAALAIVGGALFLKSHKKKHRR